MNQELYAWVERALPIKATGGSIFSMMILLTECQPVWTLKIPKTMTLTDVQTNTHPASGDSCAVDF